MTAIAAVAAGSTLAARTAVAALATLTAGAAVTARGIEVGRAADRADVIGHIAAGNGCTGQRDHRRSQKHTRDRAEPGHMTEMSQFVVRLAVSPRLKATSHCYVHILSSCASWLLRSFRTGS
jgi:hypothetical protein